MGVRVTCQSPRVGGSLRPGLYFALEKCSKFTFCYFIDQFMYLTEVVVFWTIIDTDDTCIHVRMCARARVYAFKCTIRYN